MSSNFQQDSIGQNRAIGVAVTIFTSIALYNALELSVLIPLSFRAYRSLYFWSLSTSTVLGVIPTCLGTLFQYFALAPLWLSLLLQNIGFICMVPTQSVVLYSRLHLITTNRRLLRFLKWLIIIDTTILLIPTVTLNFGSEYFPHSWPWVRSFDIIERLQITWFSLQEMIISSVYIIETARMIKISPKEDKKRNKILYELVGINIVAIGMDVALLILEFLGYYSTQIMLKALVYSIKLKMEFAVLGLLLSIVRAHPSGQREFMSTDMSRVLSG